MNIKQQNYLRECFDSCGKTAKIIAYEMDVSESTLSRAKNSGFNSLSLQKLDALIIAINASKKDYLALGDGESVEASPFNDMTALLSFFENQVEQQRKTFEDALDRTRSDYQNALNDLKRQHRRLLVVLSVILILLVLATFADALNGAYGYIRR